MNKKRKIWLILSFIIIIMIFPLFFTTKKTKAYTAEVIRYIGEPITITFAIGEDSNYQVRLGNDESSALLFTMQSGIANFYNGEGDIIPTVPALAGWFLNMSVVPELVGNEVYDVLICYEWFQQINYVSVSNIGSTGWYRFYGFSYDDLRYFYFKEFDTNFAERLIFVVNDDSLGYTSSVAERVDLSIEFLLENFNQLVVYGYNTGYNDALNENPQTCNPDVVYDQVEREYQGNLTRWIWALFSGITGFLNIQIGNISIGAIILIPLAITLAWFIIRSLRGGGSG